MTDQSRDVRPRWLLRKLALISQHRKARYPAMPEDAGEWWQQIVEAAADLKLETSPRDWERWPE